MNRIDRTFKELGRSGKKALIPYIMAGDPDLDATKTYINDLESSGADIIELGVPFSDPLADGPTIQRAAERSLKKGTTLKKVLGLVKDIRKTSEIPLILMTYYNPVFKMGIESFITKAVKSGVDGVIIPDLIPDEADEFIKLSKQHKLDTIFLLAPTSTNDRIRKVTKASTGFIYYVSITGITGAKLSMGNLMKNTLDTINRTTRKPVAVGFGVSNAKEAAAVAILADGVIIGSAIVKLIAKGKSIRSFVKNIRKAI
ncbi:tryptophan synthase alpha chain [bacterium BMS3Abin09]|nr:tryptophan synthase alpha chain [bacterium BMS3Abin09]GBE41131.1 tryptophan synthase alpha chain [bacterium BMS3Bbin09]HDN94457.1 tryptophan synthase subunit alpha [Nitrospirota bacterium]